jgi:hypothetical protein
VTADRVSSPDQIEALGNLVLSLSQLLHGIPHGLHLVGVLDDVGVLLDEEPNGGEVRVIEAGYAIGGWTTRT